jgi:ornithine cyclodeaminase
MLVMNHAQVVQAMPMEECIEVMADALKALARGEILQPLRTTVRPSGTDTLLALMPAHRSGTHPVYGVKTVCVAPRNSGTGKDIHQGSVQLFDGESGEPLACLNGSAITSIRTAAVTAVATRVLARETAGDLAIIGAGHQARAHLIAMAAVRPLKRVRVADLSIERAQRFAEEMGPRFSFPVEPVASAEAAVDQADLIVTLTTSTQPVIEREWIAKGTHINLVGASFATAREVDGATIAASRFYVDRRESTLNESGDYLMALKEGAIRPGHIWAEIGEVLIGEAEGRTSSEEITVFKALGLAIEDVAAAQHLYNKATKAQIGTWLEF